MGGLHILPSVDNFFKIEIVILYNIINDPSLFRDFLYIIKMSTIDRALPFKVAWQMRSHDEKSCMISEE